MKKQILLFAASLAWAGSRLWRRDHRLRLGSALWGQTQQRERGQ